MNNQLYVKCCQAVYCTVLTSCILVQGYSIAQVSWCESLQIVLLWHHRHTKTYISFCYKYFAGTGLPSSDSSFIWTFPLTPPSCSDHWVAVWRFWKKREGILVMANIAVYKDWVTSFTQCNNYPMLLCPPSIVRTCQFIPSTIESESKPCGVRGIQSWLSNSRLKNSAFHNNCSTLLSFWN